jgi:VanZ family protein
MLNKYRIFLSWTLVVVWMILIYMLSAQPVDQSSHLSSGITEFIMGTTMEHAQFQRCSPPHSMTAL